MDRLIKDRRGIALAYPIIFLMLMSCAGLVLDIGRGHMVKAKMQTIVDSSSLAGASTAEVVQETSLAPGSDSSGNPVLQEVVTSQKVQIMDTDKADELAKKAADANDASSGFWDKVMGSLSWTGHVDGSAKYKSEARAKLAPGFLSFLGSKQTNVFTEGEAEAYVDQEKQEGDNGN